MMRSKLLQCKVHATQGNIKKKESAATLKEPYVRQRCKNDTELTEFFTSLHVVVDRFHYPGHKSSDVPQNRTYCQICLDA